MSALDALLDYVENLYQQDYSGEPITRSNVQELSMLAAVVREEEKIPCDRLRTPRGFIDEPMDEADLRESLRDAESDLRIARTLAESWRLLSEQQARANFATLQMLVSYPSAYEMLPDEPVDLKVLVRGAVEAARARGLKPERSNP